VTAPTRGDPRVRLSLKVVSRIFLVRVASTEKDLMSKNAVQTASGGDRRRWRALIALCFGVLMIVLDTTVVNVALPSIRDDLKFTENALIWIVNAYGVTYGGSLLLCGRLGDLYGHRRMFLIGIALFTIASLACGLANTQGLLVAARAVQGLSGAVVVAVSLSLIMNVFVGDIERTKALGIYSFVCLGGSSVGLLLGGTLTSLLNWHWIFFVNVPLGTAVYALCLSLLPNVQTKTADGQLDVWGAVTVTTSLMLANYAIANDNETNENSAQTYRLLACAAALFVVFLIIETRAQTPLMPLHVLRRRNLAISSAVCTLWAAGMYAWGFISALYMRLVLGYGPMQVGLAFLPVNIIVAAFSLGLSAKLVTRFGIRKSLGSGMMLTAAGLALLARAPVDGDFMTHVLPSMILVGLGAGSVFNPLLLAVLGDVAPSESGLASGIVNTMSLMGGALGLAILASFSVARTNDLLASGASTPVALTGGYHVAFLLSAVCVSTAALLGSSLLRTRVRATESDSSSVGAAAPPSAKD